jgi:hypothetical protein
VQKTSENEPRASGTVTNVLEVANVDNLLKPSQATADRDCGMFVIGAVY